MDRIQRRLTGLGRIACEANIHRTGSGKICRSDGMSQSHRFEVSFCGGQPGSVHIQLRDNITRSHAGSGRESSVQQLHIEIDEIDCGELGNLEAESNRVALFQVGPVDPGILSNFPGGRSVSGDFRKITGDTEIQSGLLIILSGKGKIRIACREP